MTTRTQIIEGLRAAKHKHLVFCAICNCGASEKNAAIDAAIALLEKPEAVQEVPKVLAEPVAYPSREQLNQWRSEWLDTVGGEVDEYVTRKSIEWYRSQRPAPVQQAEPIVCPSCKGGGKLFDLAGNLADCAQCNGLGAVLKHPAPKPADEQPVADVDSFNIWFKANKWRLPEMTPSQIGWSAFCYCAAAIRSAPRPADPDLVALADEIEGVFMGLLRCKADCGFSRADDLCDCGMSNKRTRLRELAERIRKGVV